MYLTKQKIVFCLALLIVCARGQSLLGDFGGGLSGSLEDMNKLLTTSTMSFGDSLLGDLTKSTLSFDPTKISTKSPYFETTCESRCDMLNVMEKVCGSDGTTYKSGCHATCAQVLFKPGACCVCTTHLAPVCDQESYRTYPNACAARCAGVSKMIDGACSENTLPTENTFDSITDYLNNQCGDKDPMTCFQLAKEKLINQTGTQDISIARYQEHVTNIATERIGERLLECKSDYETCKDQAEHSLKTQLGVDKVSEDFLNQKIAESAGLQLTKYLNNCTRTDRSSCMKEGMKRLKKVLNRSDIDPVQIDRLNKESAREQMNKQYVACMGTTYDDNGRNQCKRRARASLAKLTGQVEVSKVDLQETLKKASARSAYKKLSSCVNAKKMAGEGDFAKCRESSDVKNVLESVSGSDSRKVSLTKIQDRLEAGFQDALKSSVNDCLLFSKNKTKCMKDAIQDNYLVLHQEAAPNSEVEDLLSKTARGIVSENMKACIGSRTSKNECEKKAGDLLIQIKGRTASNIEIKEVIRAGAQNTAQDVFTACREVNATTLMQCTELAKSALKDARGDANPPRDEEIQNLRQKWAARETKHVMLACHAAASKTNVTLRKQHIASCKYSSEIIEKLQNTLGKKEIDNADILDTIKRGAVDEVGEKAKSCVKAAVKAGSSKDDASLKCRKDAKLAIEKAMGKDSVKETETREFLNDAVENHATEYLKACRESGADCKNLDAMKTVFQEVALKSVSKDDVKQIITSAAQKESFRAFEACKSLAGDATRCVEDSGAAFREAIGENVTKIRARKALMKGAMKSIASVVSELGPDEIKSKVMNAIRQMKTDSPIGSCESCLMNEKTKKVVRQALVSRIKACKETNSSKADCVKEVQEILQKMPFGKSDSATDRTRQILRSTPEADVVTKDSIKSLLASVDLHPNAAQSQRLLDSKASDVVADYAESCRETKSDKKECREEIIARYKEARNISDSDSDGKSRREQIIRKGISTLLKSAHSGCVDSGSEDVRKCIVDQVKDTVAQIRPGVKPENEIDDALAAKVYDTFEACKMSNDGFCLLTPYITAGIKSSNKTMKQMLYRVKMQAMISSSCSESDRDTCDTQSGDVLSELFDGDATKVEATRQQIATIKAAEAQSDCELDKKASLTSAGNCIEEGKKRFQENGGFGYDQISNDIQKMAKSRTDGKKLEVAHKESLDIVVKYGTTCGESTIKTIKDAVVKAAQEASNFGEAIEIAKANATACQIKYRLPLKKELQMVEGAYGVIFDEGAKNISERVTAHLRAMTKLRRHLSTTDVSSSQTTTMEETGETTTAGAGETTTAGAGETTTAGAGETTTAGVSTTSIGNGDTKATTTKEEVVISGTSHSLTLSCLSVLSWAIVNSL